MKTPIVDFVRSYAQSNAARFHMPGHKGTPYLGIEALDITEVAGADVLDSATGIIAESEENATALFGTAHTFYSTEGSTLAIKAMLRLVTAEAPRGRRPLILAGRNAHKAFVYGCALLDIDVRWLVAKEAEHLCVCTLTAHDVQKALEQCEVLPQAVYLTSPDYLGNMADVAGIARVCGAYDVPLLVDNAHGAYLKFLSPSRHPIDLGATMCADSAHKTLPVLTGGAYLHIAKNAKKRYVENARAALSLFASTSPSYLVLQSLDLVNRTLATGYDGKIQKTAQTVLEMKMALATHGVVCLGDEPLKLTVQAAPLGYTGTALATYLREYNIEVEFADLNMVVMMISPDNTAMQIHTLEQALAALPPMPVLRPSALPVTNPVRVLSLREAMLAPCEVVPIERAIGRICAYPAVSCPPAIPVVVSGECIDDVAVELFHYYGMTEIAVVKK